MLVLRAVHRLKALVWVPVQVDCVIYCYTNIDTDSDEYGWTYVGQTYREEQRKRAHLSQESFFDKALRANPHFFEYEVLERKSFTPAQSSLESETLTNATAWLNDREEHWVARKGSYGQYNRTTGGQKGKTQAFHDAMLLDRKRRWETRIAGFKWFLKKHGDLDIVIKYVIRCDDSLLNGFKLGHCVERIRCGHIQVPPLYKQQLQYMGFIFDRFALSTEVRWKALQHYFDKNGHLRVPASYVLSGTGDPIIENVRLGLIVDNIRSGHTKTSQAERERLNWMLFVWDVRSADRLTRLKGFRWFKGKFGHLNVPQAYKIKDPSIPELDGYALGFKLRNLRRGDIKPSPNEVKELNEMGFVWSKSASMQQRRMKALKWFKKTHGHFKIQLKYRLPQSCDKDIRGYALGRQMSDIKNRRMDRVRISGEDIQEILNLGFFMN